MFALGLLLVLAGLALGLNAHRVSSALSNQIAASRRTLDPHGRILASDDEEQGQTKVRGLGGASFIMLALGVILMLGSCVTSVSAGNVGVPVIFGSVQPTVLHEGLNFINPFASVQQMSVRSQTYTMVSSEGEGQVHGDDSIFAQSSDGVVLTLNVSVVYKLNDVDAPWVYRNLGANYAESIVRSAARSAVPDSTSKFTFEDAYAAKRPEIAEAIRTRMNESIAAILKQYPGFTGSGVSIQQVFIREVKPSPQLLIAIEQKMTAQQQAQQMDFTLEKERKEAQRKAIEAQGIQDFQSIVSKGINEQLLKWKGIEATEKLANSPNSKVVIVGGKDGLPVILGNQ